MIVFKCCPLCLSNNLKGATACSPSALPSLRQCAWRGPRISPSEPKPGAPATIPTFNLVSMADLMKTLRADPTSHSVIEFNDVNHFDPWILLMQSVRAAVVEADAASPHQRASRRVKSRQE